MTPIFQDARQAIQFAYVLEGMPAKQDSVLGKAMRKALEEAGMLEPVEKGSICFDGMNDLEVRGQCALIRLAVEALLPAPEAWAVKSRYGHTHIHTNPDRSREFFFSEGRKEAMRNLIEYLAPSFSTTPRAALMLLVARYCAENDQLRPSLRLIEKEGGSSKSALQRTDKAVKGHIRRLIDQGVQRLEPAFIREGLIYPREVSVRQREAAYG
jgi:hypothetical protein